jgi:hypothetical protein
MALIVTPTAHVLPDPGLSAVVEFGLASPDSVVERQVVSADSSCRALGGWQGWQGWKT